MKNQITNNILFPHNIKLTPYPENIPKSDHYRNELSEMIGKNVCVFGKFTIIRRELVDGINVNKILIQDAYVIKNRKMISVDHMWTTIPKGFMHKNHIKQNRSIACTGYLYEYISKNTRNIGFKLATVREVPNE